MENDETEKLKIEMNLRLLCEADRIFGEDSRILWVEEIEIMSIEEPVLVQRNKLPAIIKKLISNIWNRLCRR